MNLNIKKIKILKAKNCLLELEEYLKELKKREMKIKQRKELKELDVWSDEIPISYYKPETRHYYEGYRGGKEARKDYRKLLL